MALTQISTAGVKDDAVTAGKIPANAVGSSELADNAVDTAAIAADAVTGAKIANDAVGAEHIEVLDADLQLADAAKIQVGTGNDLEIYHDGSSSHIKNNVGNLTIDTENNHLIVESNSGTMAKFFDEAAVELYHDGNKKLETTTYGVSTDGALNLNGTGDKIYIADGGKLVFGGGSDLQIYHDGTNSYILDNGTGHLNIKTNGTEITLTKTPHETMAKFIVDGAVELYHNNVLRLSTASNGVSVQGRQTVQCNADSVNSHLQTTNSSGAYIQHATGASGATIAYVGHSSQLCGSPTVGNYAIRFEGDALEFSKSTSIQARITSHGGIAFGSDTAAANTLDDYEEGEYTPVVSDSASGTVYTYNTHYEFRSNSGTTNQKVSYVKIGSMVYLNFSIYFNASIDKRFRISLPFSFTGSNYQIGFTPVIYSINMGGDTLGTLGAQGSKFDIFRTTNATTTTAGHTTVPVTANTEMYFNFHYEAS